MQQENTITLCMQLAFLGRGNGDAQCLQLHQLPRWLVCELVSHLHTSKLRVSGHRRHQTRYICCLVPLWSLAGPECIQLVIFVDDGLTDLMLTLGFAHVDSACRLL